MQTARRAVIDVGTNSVKLLVAEVDGHVVRPVWEEGNQTRLGENFYDTHRLQARAIERTAHAVAKFAEKARFHQAASLRVIATSAARDAVKWSAMEPETPANVTAAPMVAAAALKCDAPSRRRSRADGAAMGRRGHC